MLIPINKKDNFEGRYPNKNNETTKLISKNKEIKTLSFFTFNLSDIFSLTPLCNGLANLEESQKEEKKAKIPKKK